MEQRSVTVEMALDAGFSHAGYWDLEKAGFLSEVRDMCADNKCGKYGKSWACPPGCGTLEETSAFIHAFDYGLLLQMTGQMEDDFDMETIEETERLCQENLKKWIETLEESGQYVRPLAPGVCTKCETCTYPEAPCRFPDKISPSLEACGIFVSRECTKSGIGYYYGPQTMTFTAALLVKETV